LLVAKRPHCSLQSPDGAEDGEGEGTLGTLRTYLVTLSPRHHVTLSSLQEQIMTYPPLPLADWQPTRDTVQGYSKLLGKIRRALTPFETHWYHVSLRVGETGLTTTAIPYGEDSFYADHTFEMIMDFMAHKLSINSSRRLQ